MISHRFEGARVNNLVYQRRKNYFLAKHSQENIDKMETIRLMYMDKNVTFLCENLILYGIQFNQIHGL